MYDNNEGRRAQDAPLEDQLAALELSLPAAPAWAALRSRITTQLESEEPAMGIFGRLISRGPWPLRLAMGLAALALLVAGSLLLPFARGVEHAPKLMASSGGYVLVYDFGSTRPSDQLVEQGTAITHKWKEGDPANSAIDLAMNEDIVSGMLIVSVSLIGATEEQARELSGRLAVLPELPAPTISEASWYQVAEVEARGRGELFLYEFDHGFYFPRGTSGEQIEQALRDYLIERDGECTVEINVEAEWSECGACVNVLIG